MSWQKIQKHWILQFPQCNWIASFTKPYMPGKNPTLSIYIYTQLFSKFVVTAVIKQQFPQVSVPCMTSNVTLVDSNKKGFLVQIQEFLKDFLTLGDTNCNHWYEKINHVQKWCINLMIFITMTILFKSTFSRGLKISRHFQVWEALREVFIRWVMARISETLRSWLLWWRKYWRAYFCSAKSSEI